MKKLQHPVNLIGWIFFSCLSVILVPTPLAAQRNAHLSEQLDKLMTAFTATGLFNGTVLVSHKNEILLKKGYGYSDIENRNPHHPATKFAIYSITKPITATIILKLLEQERIQLDDKLSRFYPGIPWADSISILHLLTHTSGLYPYNNDFSMPTASEASIIGFLSQRPLKFQPGQRWEYCNTGYYILGFIIEKLTGGSYENALDTYVFQPSGMSQSGMNFQKLAGKDKAIGYQFYYPDSCQAATLFEEAELRSSGGIWSSINDLYKFHIALQNNSIVSDEWLSKAYISYKNNYGYGWFIDSLAGKRIVSHSGGAPGFRSYLVRIPETNTCIVLLANAENFDLTPIKDQLLRAVLGLDYQVPKTQSLSAKNLAAIAGVYRFGADRFLYVKQAKNRLIAQISGQKPVLLLAENNHRFLVDGMDGYLDFFASKQGYYDSVILKRKDKVYEGIRTVGYWGIAGTALPNGWQGPDVRLFPQHNNPAVWSIDSIMLKEGVLKFRYNNDWTFNLGMQQSGSALIAGGEDIPVKAGTYKILLNLTTSEAFHYCIEEIP